VLFVRNGGEPVQWRGARSDRFPSRRQCWRAVAKAHGALLSCCIAIVAARAASTAALPDQRAKEGGDVVVEVTLAPPAGVTSAQLAFTYDPAVVLPTSAHLTRHTSSFALTADFSTAGLVSLSLSGPSAPAEPAVAWVVFHVPGTAGAESPLTWTACVLNGGAIPCTTQNGRVRAATAQSVVSMPDAVSAASGSLTTISVSAVPADGAESIDLVVQFDPGVLEAQSASTTPITTAMFLTPNLTVPGEARISMFGIAPISGSGPILDLEFLVTGGPGDATALDIVSVDFNEFGIPTVIDDGSFSACSGADADGDGHTGCGGDCNDSNPAVYQGAPELCDGLDNDCNGVTDDAVAPSGIPALRESKPAPGTVTLAWAAVPAATAYDVVRGGVGALVASGGDYSASPLVCVANDTASTTVNDTDAPATANGFWYLVRAVSCGGAGTYDTTSPRQSGGRDAEIAAAAGACP